MHLFKLEGSRASVWCACIQLVNVGLGQTHMYVATEGTIQVVAM